MVNRAEEERLITDHVFLHHSKSTDDAQRRDNEINSKASGTVTASTVPCQMYYNCPVRKSLDLARKLQLLWLIPLSGSTCTACVPGHTELIKRSDSTAETFAGRCWEGIRSFITPVSFKLVRPDIIIFSLFLHEKNESAELYNHSKLLYLISSVFFFFLLLFKL